MTTRRERIQEMLAEEPHDVFLRYSLALEWRKEGEHQRSCAGLEELIQETPPYVPAFFMLAQQLAGLGQTDAAREALRQGIDAARLQGDQHAAGEMSEFLATLGG